MTSTTVLLLSTLALAHAYPNGAPNARLPAMGWSSWIALGPGAEHPIFDYCDEAGLRATVDAFVSLGLKDAGYTHIHYDDCWADTVRNASGYLQPEADHFPNGMTPVVDYVHAQGLNFGLYTCSGTLTCVGGRQGSFGHWDQDAAVFAEWGVDWVKQDFCNVPNEYKNNPIPLYTNMSRALNATGRPMTFAMCEWGVASPWLWGNSIAQSWRIAGDHTAVWDSTKATIRSSAAIPAKYTGVPYGWNDMDMLETGCYEQCAHANGRQPNLTAIEYKTEFGMWAISASPLLFTAPIMNCSAPPQPPLPSCSVSLTHQDSLSTCTLGSTYGCSLNDTMWTGGGCRGEFRCNGKNVTCSVDGVGEHECPCQSRPAPPAATCTPWISDLQREILLNTEVIAINQDVTPQGTPLVPGDISKWVRWLSDGSAALALYNEEDTPMDITFTFAEVGWVKGTTAKVRDLWEHKDLGDLVDAMPAITVLPHQAQLFRLTKV